MTPTNNAALDAADAQLRLRGITKQYPGTLANDSIDLVIKPGEVHALLGENGAGKSTLVKIIYGVVKADAGEILWQGQPMHIHSPAQARRLGIGMVFQHFNLFDTLTVAENISLCLEGDSDLKEIVGGIKEISARYGLPIEPGRHVHSLSVGERQRVEIIRCLLQGPKLLIMDEPTSVLTPQEVDKLFETLKRLGSEGCSILYISHKLDEIMELCDSATVLRGGRVTAHCDPRKETAKSLAEMMIGSALPVTQRKSVSGDGTERLVIDGLSLPADLPFGTDLKDIHLTMTAGEVVGIAGVAGNGQKELLAALSGERKAGRAEAVRINGRPVATLNAAQRRAHGLAFVPEERLGRGAVPEMGLSDNALLTGYQADLVSNGLIRFAKTRDFARGVIDAFNVVTAGTEAEAKSLSGGNLQKFITGREIMLRPKVLILAHPTWGVDVGAATAIHQAIIDLKETGAAVLMVSEDLDEIFEVCDRIAVISEGRLSPTKKNGETSVEEIGLWMSGQFPDQGERTVAAHAD